MATASFRSRFADYSYRTLRWGRDHVPPGARSVVGVLFMVGGVFGFLPVLGFWMLPLGVAFVALDIPLARRRLDRWILAKEKQAGAGEQAQDKTSKTT